MPQDRCHAERLRRRLQLLGWWREMQRRHPGGLLPLATAARLLGVTRQRVVQLIDEGRLPVETMPGGAKTDRFIPADALFYAPSTLDRGRPLVFSSEKGYPVRRGPEPNVYGSGGPSGTFLPESAPVRQVFGGSS